MLDFHQKRKVRAVMYHRVTLIILSVLVLLAIHSTWSVYQKKSVSEEMKNVALKHAEELRLRNRELKSNIDRLQTPTGIEQEIRSKFTVAKTGENMVVVVPDDNSGASTTNAYTSFWQKIWHFFSR